MYISWRYEVVGFGIAILLGWAELFGWLGAAHGAGFD
jgi:hypothetical protein